MNGNKIQVFIVSQQYLFRQGVEHLLSTVENVEVSGASEVNDTVLSTIDSVPPDVILVDIDSQPEDSLTLARTIKRRLASSSVIILTSKPGDAQLFQALKAQSAAYLSKEVTADQLVRTIRNVARGEHPINESLVGNPRIAEQVLHQFQELSWRSEVEVVMSPITPRETEILKYIAEGYLNKQSAAELGISQQTIKNHVTSILRKLNANARTEAVVIAIKQGLINIE